LSALGRRAGAGAEACLCVCPSPTELTFLLRAEGWPKRFRRVAAWVIDSFWLDRIPRIVRYARLFDHLFVTTEEDVEAWSRATGTPTSWLPWGTDALRLGGGSSERTWDLLRVGRQPPDWDDDAETEQACRERGLSFHGRPAGSDDAGENQRALMAIYGRSKFLLAFSNVANPTNYTHPTREYLTARWVDALASGATVAGIPPKAPSIERLLWPEANLDLGSIRSDEGLPILADAVRDWTPQLARENSRRALERLDWRWRFAKIAAELGECSIRLEADIQAIRRKIESDAQESRNTR
jgi:hypothetical protein